MKWSDAGTKARLYFTGALVLLVSLAVAVAVYFIAEEDAGSGLGYEMVGGTTYTITPGQSKTYVHDLQLYGGKANVLADEFRRWFLGLWQGKNLASTIAEIGALIALGIFFVAYHSPSDPRGDAGDRHKT